MLITDIPVSGWRRVAHVEDEDAGLNAIIAIHDDTLGPGCGGCRIYPYASFDDALEDVKNLSRGMTFKNALGGIPFGGGKSVIIADPKTDKTPEMFRAFGRALEALGGEYYTAEDSGVTERDLEIVKSETRYVGGIGVDEIGGNPSPFTARGVWRGMQAAARHRLGATSLSGVRVAILGVGAVGAALARHLHEEGAELVVSDVNLQAVNEMIGAYGAKSINPEDAAGADVDIFAPCAFGGAINDATIGQLKASIVAGAANNQLATPEMDAALRDRDVLYAPDYVINAVGVISVGLEILGHWTKDELESRIDRIGDTLTGIFERAKSENRPTGEIADEMAQEVISRGRVAAQ